MTIPESVRSLVATGPLAHLTTLNSVPERDGCDDPCAECTKEGGD